MNKFQDINKICTVQYCQNWSFLHTFLDGKDGLIIDFFVIPQMFTSDVQLWHHPAVSVSCNKNKSENDEFNIKFVIELITVIVLR